MDEPRRPRHPCWWLRRLRQPVESDHPLVSQQMCPVDRSPPSSLRRCAASYCRLAACGVEGSLQRSMACDDHAVLHCLAGVRRRCQLLHDADGAGQAGWWRSCRHMSSCTPCAGGRPRPCRLWPPDSLVEVACLGSPADARIRPAAAECGGHGWAERGWVSGLDGLGWCVGSVGHDYGCKRGWWGACCRALAARVAGHEPRWLLPPARCPSRRHA